MPKKRGNGEGSLFQYRGMWIARIITGYDLKTGKPIRDEFRDKNKKVSQDWLSKNLHRASSTKIRNRKKHSFEECVKLYLDAQQQLNLSESTYNNYDRYCKLVLPALGRFPIHKIDVWHIEEFFNGLSETINSSEQGHLLSFFRGVFTNAIRLQILEVNLFNKYSRRIPKAENISKVWTANQAKLFLESIKEHRLFSAFYFYLRLGMRRGELLALTWDDVKNSRFDINKSISDKTGKLVIGKLKTKRSYRVIPLSGEELSVLERHRKRQDDMREKSKVWHESAYVFTSTIGTPIFPRNLNRAFSKLVGQVGLPMIRVHDLRHTAITLMRDQGIPIETAAAITGHDIVTLLKIYSHVDDGRKAQAAEQRESMFHINLDLHSNDTHMNESSHV